MALPFGELAVRLEHTAHDRMHRIADPDVGGRVEPQQQRGETEVQRRQTVIELDTHANFALELAQQVTQRRRAHRLGQRAR
ncbi:MAG: hypothetical protein KF731_17215, partial [Thauera sp.]|nr:hypothetical protein [Thauera sp.]